MGLYSRRFHTGSAFLAACLAGLLPLLSGAEEQAKGNTLPEIIARVGDETITRAEFKRDLTYRYKKAQLEFGRQIPRNAAFREHTLKELVDGRVLHILAHNAGIEVSDAAVRQDFEERRASIPSEEAFQQYLERMGLEKDELLEEIRSRMIIERYIAQETEDIEISDAEVREEYRQMREAGVFNRRGETADFAHILVRPKGDTPSDWAAARVRAVAVRDRIEGGDDFAEVARDVSQDQVSRQRGGLYIEATDDAVLPALAERMFELPLDTLSEPFRSALGWHLMIVYSRNEGGVVPLTKVEDRIRRQLRKEQQDAIIAERIAAAKKGIPIETYLPSKEAARE